VSPIVDDDDGNGEVNVDVESRSGRSRWRWPILAAFVLLTVAIAARPSSTPAFEASGPPLPLPANATLTDLSADDFEGVLVGLRGTPVIVNIWASWCAPCRTETPLLQRAATENLDKIVIIGVASRDQRSSAEDFMEEFDITFPNVFDYSGDIRRRLGLRGFPSTYVFGRDGELRTSIVGGLTEQRLAAVIDDVTA
jgi:cytochrome c biogenesis protein CcmG/thiol:disulfide interchange protein DsbE